MKRISAIGVVAGFFGCIFATVLGQGCDSGPGTLGGGSGGKGGGVIINLGGQGGARAWGSCGRTGSVATDAAVITDVPAAARRDASIEGKGVDPKASPPTGTDGPQAVDQGATRPDVQQTVDQAAKPDRPGKEAVVRDTVGVFDVGSRDVAVPDGPPPVLDASVGEAPTADDAAAMGCNHGGVTYAIGDSFPSDCNTCFCLAGGDVVCTVKPCAVDSGAG